MQFCPRCGGLLKPGASGKLTCGNCGFVSGLRAKAESKVAVVEGEKDVYPRVEASCPKCGNNEAFFWTTQTRAADEPETRFYKCTKCKHTWREYK